MKYLPLFILFVAACVPSAFAEVKHSTLVERLDRSVESFDNVARSKVGVLPPGVLARAQGIMIFREWGAGFVFGGKGGAGVAMERMHDGRWGPPAFFTMAEGSFGLQIGVQRVDLVFLFMNRDSLRLLENPKFRIGVDAAAAAGPIGADAEAKIGAPILVYTDDAGLYAGATFEGAVLGPDRAANESLYGIPGITVPEILSGRHVDWPREAGPLRDRLLRYEDWRDERHHERHDEGYR